MPFILFLIAVCQFDSVRSMSGSVFLTNLDDYILPSQACVNPLVTAKIKAADDENKKQQLNSSGNNVNQKPTKSAKIQLSLDMSTSEFDVPPSILPPVKPDLIKSKMVDNKKVAAVSLNDCLACRLAGSLIWLSL